jgi:hypothetical protein
MYIFLGKAVDKKKSLKLAWRLTTWTNGANVFCFLSSLPLLPHPATTTLFGCYLSSLYSRVTLYHVQDCAANPYNGRGFVGPKKNTIVCLFNGHCQEERRRYPSQDAPPVENFASSTAANLPPVSKTSTVNLTPEANN